MPIAASTPIRTPAFSSIARPKPTRVGMCEGAGVASGASGPSGPYGTNGQKARRPKIASSAGSSVSIATIALSTPIAPSGPRPAVPFTCANVRHISASTTVLADATTAGPEALSALASATCLSCSWRSSSR